MKIETREIYKCDHCNKLYQRKHACEKHEIMCSKNPDNFRACFGCKHLTKVEVPIQGYYWEYEANVLYCSKLEKYLHPPKVEHKGNALDFGRLNEPMPRECKDFDDIPF